MAAVAMRLRAELRRRWLAWLGLALILGVAGGGAIAAAAGARRTDSAYPRFVEKHHGYDVILGGIATDEGEDALHDQIIKSIISRPEVEAYTRGDSFLVSDRLTVRRTGETFGFPELFINGASDVSSPELNTSAVIRGRTFVPDAPDEAVADFTIADRLDLRVGDVLELPLSNQETGAEVTKTVRLVGVIASPWDMPAVGQTSFAGLTVSPGFVRVNTSYIQQTEDAPSVKLKHGAADIPSFVRSVEALAREVDVPGTLPAHLRGVGKTLRFEVTALWLLAALIGLAALAIVGQAIARQAVIDADDHATLRAIAMSRRQLFTVGMLRASVIGAVAAVVSAAVAFLASPLTPRGLARVVEPDPGFAADWTALGIGAVITAAIALIASAIPAWRAAGSRSTDAAERGSRVAAGLASMGAGPSVVMGVRLALEPGRGRRALPVRLTTAGIAVALAAFWAAASFTQSLNHLIATPELQGYAWDAITTGPSEKELAAALHRDSDVAAASPGGATNIMINGEHLIPLTYEPSSISPVVLSGRAPRAADEIALGTGAMRAFHKRVGDKVVVNLESNDPGYKPPPQRFRIVGTVVVPPFFFLQVEPGHGAAITIEGSYRLDPHARGARDDEGGLPYIVRYRRGVDVRAKLEGLRKQLGFIFTFQLRQPGSELAGVSRSSGLPYTLTQILLFMAAATLVHALVSAVRKRRHDLAILKTLGFSRRQVRTTVATQASTFVILALVIGLPVGAALGNWAWTWFVGTIGLVPSTVTPPPIVVANVIILTLLLGNAIALLPGRSAARTKPAVVLRTE